MEALAPVIGFTLTVGVVLGSASNAYQNFRYEWALEDPDMLHLVDEMGNPVSQEAK